MIAQERALAAAALIALSGAANTQPDPPRAHGSALKVVLKRHALSGTARAQVEALFVDLAPIFERLPLAKLIDVSVRGNEIEFVFPGKTRVKLPDQKRLVFDARQGRLKSVEIDGASLRFGARMRFRSVGGEFRIHEGDVEARKWLCWWGLRVHTETRSSTIVRDSRGRPFVELDAAGNARRDERGELCFQAATRWLVLEAKGERVELPLPLAL